MNEDERYILERRDNMAPYENNLKYMCLRVIENRQEFKNNNKKLENETVKSRISENDMIQHYNIAD